MGGFVPALGAERRRDQAKQGGAGRRGGTDAAFPNGDLAHGRDGRVDREQQELAHGSGLGESNDLRERAVTGGHVHNRARRPLLAVGLGEIATGFL